MLFVKKTLEIAGGLRYNKRKNNRKYGFLSLTGVRFINCAILFIINNRSVREAWSYEKADGNHFLVCGVDAWLFGIGGQCAERACDI